MSTTASPEIGTSILAGDINTNVHVAGAGQPVLLIHGSGPGVSAWANWRPVLPSLSQRFRCIAPDVVGFGYTERPEGIRYDIHTWLAHVTGVLDALELNRISIVGNSFGGAIALRLVIEQPDRVDRVVLMGSAGLHFPVTPALDAVWGYAPSVKSMRAMLDTFAFDRSLVTDDLARLRYHASIRPGVQEAYSSMFPAPRQRSLDALASDEADIAAIRHPVLVVHGADDRVVPVESSHQLARLIPGSELHVFNSCGHWVQIEKSSRFLSIVTEFLIGDQMS